MARRSLRPQLNQIRTWVRQGRTDAWIAHQLEVTVQQITAFKRENELAPGEADPENGFDEEIDLRAEDDALIAAELERVEAERAAAAEAEVEDEPEAEAAEDDDAPKPRRRARNKKDKDSEAETDEDDADKGRRRGRRGGRGRKKSGPVTLEGSFDHGEEGYGLWLDPAVADDAIYAEHWAGHRPVEVTVEEDQIVIRRAGSADDA
ncbi:MAG: hypothetical protein ACR2NH_08345 [Solirubrobacteraceae bacterium]